MHPDDIPVPTDEELREMDREVVFIPSVNPSPQVLSANQVHQYNELGYLMPLEGLDASEANDLRTYFDGVLDAFHNLGRDSYSISTAHLRFARIYRLLSHPAIVGPVADLLGPDIIGWAAHFFCKMPHDGKRVPWHQDALYWPITPTRTVTVWLAIDDADPGNANMRFIPGSHVHGPLDYKVIDGSDLVLNLETQNPENYGDLPVDVALQAGQFSMHCDLLLHGSEANESDRRRSGITLRYAAAGVKAFHGWHHKGIVVKGEDVDGNWANPPCPLD